MKATLFPRSMFCVVREVDKRAIVNDGKIEPLQSTDILSTYKKRVVHATIVRAPPIHCTKLTSHGINFTSVDDRDRS